MVGPPSKLQPLWALVPDVNAYFALAQKAYEQAEQNPGDTLASLSAALFAFHLADWDGDVEAFRNSCPDWATLREIAKRDETLGIGSQAKP